MTTPERGLFEQLISRLHAAAIVIANLPEVPGYNGSILQLDDIEAGEIAQTLDNAADELGKMERRLTEAETACNLLSDDLRNQLRITAAKEDERMEAHRRATQLRARCGELERLVVAVRAHTYIGISCADVAGKNWFDVRDAVLSPTAAPQPAQQDECTRAGKHDWGSITGGMSCYKCGTSWWANTPEPKPAQEQTTK